METLNPSIGSLKFFPVLYKVRTRANGDGMYMTKEAHVQPPLGLKPKLQEGWGSLEITWHYSTCNTEWRREV